MTQFECFLAFFSLMLGLGVAQLLTGYGNLLRETPTPRLGIILPLVGAQHLRRQKWTDALTALQAAQ